MASDDYWSGSIGILQRHEADVAVATIAMSPARAQVVDFSTPIFITRCRNIPYLRESNAHFLT